MLCAATHVTSQCHVLLLQVVCQDKKVVVAEAKTSCEQLLVAIVQDKRIADEQEKQVHLPCFRCPLSVKDDLVLLSALHAASA